MKKSILTLMISIIFLLTFFVIIVNADVKREIYDYQGSNLRYKINYSLFDAANFTGTRIDLTGNATADWFKGKFNWTTADDWNSFNG